MAVVDQGLLVIVAALVDDLGNAVRIARKREDLTQAQLAASARVGLRFLSELENGKPTVQLQRTMQVLAALGLTLGVYDQQVRLK